MLTFGAFIWNKALIKDPFEIIYLVSLYFFLGTGFRCLFLYRGVVKNRFYAPIENKELVIYALFISFISMIFLYIGYFSTFGNSLARKIHSIRSLRLENKNLFSKYSLFCAFVGFFSFTMFYSKYYLIIDFMRNPSDVAILSAQGGMFYITMLSQFPLFGALLSLANKGETRYLNICFTLNSASIFLWFLLWGHKSLLLSFFIGSIVTYHYYIRKIKIKTIFVFLIVLVVLIASVSYYRIYGIESSRWINKISESNSNFDFLFIPAIERSYHFDMLLIIVNEVNSIDKLRLGSTLTELLWFFIPRAWWNNKPRSFGYTFGLEFLNPSIYYNTSYSVPLVGELFLNFHIIGVILGFFLFGILMRAFYSGLLFIKTKIATIVYAILFLQFLHIVEGPIAGHVTFILSALLPVFILSVLGKVTK